VSAPSDPRTLALHGLRLRGFADAAGVADAVPLTVEEAEPVLEALVDQGLASYREGRMTGYSLTPAGRRLHAEKLAEELRAAGAREPLHETYRRFLGLNGRLLAVCTEWQLRDVGGELVLNDHSDAGYDEKVVAELGSIHEQAMPICDDLAGCLARYGHYGPRLQNALDRVRAGELDWFTKPMVASYHTVWFELHEDLLATLGIERGSEVPA